MSITDREVRPTAAIKRSKLAGVPAGGTNAGLGAATYLESGNLNAQYGAVGTASDTTEDPLMSYTFPANTFSITGNVSSVHAWGFLGNSSNPVTFRAYFGGQKILDTGQISGTNNAWAFYATIIRTGPSTQEIIAWFFNGTTLVATTRTLGTQTDTAAIVWKTTGQNVNPVPNSLVQTAGIIGFSS